MDPASDNIFKLPDLLPKNNHPNQEPAQQKDEKKKIEDTISSLLSGAQCSDPMILSNFFKSMCSDKVWVDTNRSIAETTYQVVSRLYMNSTEELTDRKFRDEIVQYVQNQPKSAFSIANSDISFASNGFSSSFSGSSLLFAAQSTVLDRLLRGGFIEGERQRSSGIESTSQLRRISLPESPNVIQFYVDVVTKGSSVIILNPEEELAFLKIVDMWDSTRSLFHSIKDMLMRRMDGSNIPQVWQLILDDETKKKSYDTKGVMEDSRSSAEKILLKALTPENMLPMYRLAKEQNLPSLGLGCLQMLLADLTVDMAYDGVLTKNLCIYEPKDEEFIIHTLAGDDIREFCLNWFLKNLPGQFVKAHHKLPSADATTLVSLFNKVSECVNGKNTEANETLDFFKKFQDVSKYFESINESSLKSLLQNELVWLLKILPTTLKELNLTDCNLSSEFPLGRFVDLKKLNLTNIRQFSNTNLLTDMIDLEELSLSGCHSIVELDIQHFEHLESLDISGCINLEDIFVKLPQSLKKAIAPKQINKIFSNILEANPKFELVLNS